MAGPLCGLQRSKDARISGLSRIPVVLWSGAEGQNVANCGQSTCQIVRSCSDSFASRGNRTNGTLTPFAGLRPDRRASRTVSLTRAVQEPSGSADVLRGMGPKHTVGRDAAGRSIIRWRWTIEPWRTPSRSMPTRPSWRTRVSSSPMPTTRTMVSGSIRPVYFALDQARTRMSCL
jgi:hypothetical protein